MVDWLQVPMRSVDDAVAAPGPVVPRRFDRCEGNEDPFDWAYEAAGGVFCGYGRGMGSEDCEDDPEMLAYVSECDGWEEYD